TVRVAGVSAIELRSSLTCPAVARWLMLIGRRAGFWLASVLTPSTSPEAPEASPSMFIVVGDDAFCLVAATAESASVVFAPTGTSTGLFSSSSRHTLVLACADIVSD